METLEEVLGSSMCRYSSIEKRLAILYRNQVKIYDAINKEQKDYSEEEFKEMVYHMVGGLAQANNMTFNGAILDELFNKFKNK